MAHKLSIAAFLIFTGLNLAPAHSFSALSNNQLKGTTTMATETINITPTWQGILPALILVLQNKNAKPESHREATAELMKLAKAVDDMNAANKATKELADALIEGELK